MEPYYSRDGIEIYVGDNRDVLPHIGQAHAVVTDPPYGLSFMGKGWDHQVPGIPFWQAIGDAMLPGAHLLAFGGTRTSHRMAVAIEDAGYEIRDTLQWLYGSGFPKSHDVSKAIDKLAGAEREVVQTIPDRWAGKGNVLQRSTQAAADTVNITAPATPAAEQWQGWGTALKPSYEPVICARKPLTDVPLSPIIQAEITDLLGGLICLSVSFANNAEPSSVSSQNAHAEASVSALILAAVLHGQLSADSSAPMGTFRSPEMASMCLSIVASWSNILDVCSTHGSTFTTSTATSLTTALTTLSCFLSGIMPERIIQAVSNPVGSLLSADIAERHSTADAGNWSDIQIAIAAALVTLQHDSAFTDAKSAEPISPATIQSVDSVLKRVLTELRTASATGNPLTPNHEPIIMARSPFSGTVAANVLQHGTGAINIDASRIGSGERPLIESDRRLEHNTYGPGLGGSRNAGTTTAGRWPANVILDEAAAAALDASCTTSTTGNRKNKNRVQQIAGNTPFTRGQDAPEYTDTGGASRFFYVAKSSRRDRSANGTVANNHPTCKPTTLMRYLIQLVTPPGGIVLDPFMGSGSTLVAAAELGFHAIGIELSEEYAEIAARRVDHALNERAKRLPGIDT